MYINSARNKAFTLIELLLVIAIISLLTSIVSSSLSGTRKESELIAAAQFANSINSLFSINSIGQWDFDDSNDENKTCDKSSNNCAEIYDAIYNCEDVPYGENGFRCSMYFNGVDAKIVLEQDNSNMKTESITVSVWVKPTIKAGSWNTIAIKTTDNSAAGWGLERSSIKDDFSFWVNGYRKRVLAPITWNEWQHIVGTYDGSKLIIYKNGKEVSSRDLDESLTYGQNNFHIGKHSHNAYHWNGYIDELRIYGVALDQVAIQDLYKSEALILGLKI